MIVVCDSSALINLSLINQLHLLEDMFGEVLIAPGVYNEVVQQGGERPGAEAVENASFILVEPLCNPERVTDYIDPLSPVDAEVIVLAHEQNADWVITRDRRMRSRVRREGFAAMTTFALLVEAKREGYILAVKPLLDEFRSKGVLIREGTYQETLREAGELEDELGDEEE